MKKLISIVLTIAILCSICVVSTFALAKTDFTLNGASVTVDGTADKTVNVVFSANSAMNVVALEGTFSKKEAESTSYLALTNYVSPVTLAGVNEFALDTGRFIYADDTNFVGYSVAQNGNVMTAVYTVNKDTPTGDYTVQLSLTDIQDDGFAEVSNQAYTAVVHVTQSSATPSSAYSAAVTASTDTVNVGDNVTVSITSSAKYAAAEAVLSYDTAKFQYVSTNAGTANTATSGKVKLALYGEEKSAGTVFTVTFKALAKGTNVGVTLDSAAYSEQADASTKDLIPATITTATVSFTITDTFTVTLPDIFDGDSEIESGEDYTFSVKDGDNYTYGTVTATMGGTPVTVIDNGDGTYKIENVTGALVISGTRTANTYNVTYATSTSVSLPANGTATYGTDYQFTMPTKQDYTVSITSITIGGKAYTGYGINSGVVTIPGGDITGAIVITIDQKLANISVSAEGNGAGDVTYDASTETEKDYTFSITKDSNYDYTVSATVGGNAVTVTDNKNGTYTIAAANVTGNIVITVTKTIKTDAVTVTEYVKLDGKSVYLIKNTMTKLDGKNYTYKGNAMFWSSEYGAYCYLVVASSAPTVSGEDLAIVSSAASEITYTGDVNKTGKIDANDAQLIYNIYNAYYDGFTTDVTIEKYLLADVNHDGAVNVSDAVAVIAEVFKR